MKNLLLLSGSRAAGNLPDGQTPGFLDWAADWIAEMYKDLDAPVLVVPYARPGGKTEQAYFEEISERFQRIGIDSIRAPEDGQLNTAGKVGGIYIGGGHTPTLLHKLQSSGGLETIVRLVEAGTPYIGSSAGSLIACPTIKTNNDMPGPAHDVINLNSLGLIPFQLNCHYMDDSMHDPKHQGETRDTRLKEFCIFNPNQHVLGLYEGQALRVQGDSMALWTSKNTRGTRSPLFYNDTRKEIVCSVDQPQPILL